MQENITTFDTNEDHIHIEFIVTNPKGIKHSVAGILDTGAPNTEFSDQFLVCADFLENKNETEILRPGLQTQQYGKIMLPSVTICGHQIDSFEIFVSQFEKAWGIDALIGLDFFRLFSVEIDYSKGTLRTAPYVNLLEF